MVRALISYCELSLLLVLFSVPRVFSLGTLVFPSPLKPTFKDSNSVAWKVSPISVTALDTFALK